MSSQKTMTNFFSVKRKPADQHPSKRRKAVVQDDVKDTKVFLIVGMHMKCFIRYTQLRTKKILWLMNFRWSFDKKIHFNWFVMKYVSSPWEFYYFMWLFFDGFLAKFGILWLARGYGSVTNYYWVEIKASIRFYMSWVNISYILYSIYLFYSWSPTTTEVVYIKDIRN